MLCLRMRVSGVLQDCQRRVQGSGCRLYRGTSLIRNRVWYLGARDLQDAVSHVVGDGEALALLLDHVYLHSIYTHSSIYT